jgi:hypothetical protein
MPACRIVAVTSLSSFDPHRRGGRPLIGVNITVLQKAEAGTAKHHELSASEGHLLAQNPKCHGVG